MRGRRVLLGVCGSIAAYKMADVARELGRAGADVRVVMTEAATRFVSPDLFAALTANPVVTDLFERPERVVHVELGRWAELYCIGAATAATMARLASGQASDAVGAAYLMCRCPVLVAPAMHTEMWEHPAVSRSARALASDGVSIVGPEEGDLASGDRGVGRLASAQAIVAACRAALAGPTDLAGLKILVTAGPTREPIDPVRFISNRSTGKMGYEVAATAVRRGAEVTLISGPSALTPPPGVRFVGVQTACEMLQACLDCFGAVDAAVKVAAVADWRPARPAGQKLAKQDLEGSVALEPNPDIAAELGRRKVSQVLVIFAAQTQDVIGAARSKLAAKNADLAVANLVGAPGTGFDSDTNRAALVTADAVQELPMLAKSELAGLILDRVAAIAAQRRADTSPASGAASAKEAVPAQGDS